MVSGPITLWQINGEKVQTVADFIFLGSKSLWTVTAVTKLKDAFFSWKKSYDQRKHCFADKVPYSQSYGFSSDTIWM